SVTVSGRTPSQIARAGLVTTFQHATPISGLSAIDNVLVGMTEQHSGGTFAALFGTPAYRASERRQRERAGELLHSFGLERFADRRRARQRRPGRLFERRNRRRDPVTVLAIGVATGFVYALVAVGYSLIYRTTGIVNFAQGAFVMVGAMATYWLYKQHHVPYP